jgi:hypothetical protein
MHPGEYQAVGVPPGACTSAGFIGESEPNAPIPSVCLEIVARGLERVTNLFQFLRALALPSRSPCAAQIAGASSSSDTSRLPLVTIPFTRDQPPPWSFVARAAPRLGWRTNDHPPPWSRVEAPADSFRWRPWWRVHQAAVTVRRRLPGRMRRSWRSVVIRSWMLPLSRSTPDWSNAGNSKWPSMPCERIWAWRRSGSGRRWPSPARRQRSSACSPLAGPLSGC